MDTKTCTKCRETKPLAEFNKNKSRPDGLQSRCKQCSRADSRAWVAANPEKAKARKIAEYAANPEKAKALCAAWRAANLEKAKALAAAWRAANPEKMKAKRSRIKNELTPSYVSNCLRIPVKEITPELMELKRQQLGYNRLNRQLQATLKELNHDDRNQSEPADQCHLSHLGSVDHG